MLSIGQLPEIDLPQNRNEAEIWSADPERSSSWIWELTRLTLEVSPLLSLLGGKDVLARIHSRKNYRTISTKNYISRRATKFQTLPILQIVLDDIIVAPSTRRLLGDFNNIIWRQKETLWNDKYTKWK